MGVDQDRLCRLLRLRLLGLLALPLESTNAGILAPTRCARVSRARIPKGRSCRGIMLAMLIESKTMPSTICSSRSEDDVRMFSVFVCVGARACFPVAYALEVLSACSTTCLSKAFHNQYVHQCAFSVSCLQENSCVELVNKNQHGLTAFSSCAIDFVGPNIDGLEFRV